VDGAEERIIRALPEVRTDPLSGAQAIIAADRAQRPGGAPSCAPAAPIDPASDPFAEGNEHMTPPELFALRDPQLPADGPGWQVRVVPNLYPALAPLSAEERGHRPPEADQGQARREAGPLAAHNAHLGLFTSTPARGGHEVIVNSPASVASLGDLSPAQLSRALSVWRERMRSHSGAACVQLIVNERLEAGASLPHTHAQLYALPFVPAQVARERERFGAWADRTGGSNLLADLLAEEIRHKERVVALDAQAALIAPFASRLPYQLMLVPRLPAPRFEDQEGDCGAALLGEALARLRALLGASPPLNLYVRTAPAGAEHFCWRIDIMPRLTHIAGLELATDIYLNIVSPERAASSLRAL